MVSIVKKVRPTTSFEIILFIVGVAVGILGFSMVNQVFVQEGGMTWRVLTDAFLWLILLVLLILAATTEDVKEELAVIIKELVRETRVLRDIEHDMLNEIKLLREDLNRRR